MMKNRKKQYTPFLKKKLTNGPGKICQAFSIKREENGIDLTKNEIFISENIFTTDNVRQQKINVSTRIGLRNGKGDKRKWRFYL
jgi:DNA-3-methyladenine glycosylase